MPSACCQPRVNGLKMSSNESRLGRLPDYSKALTPGQRGLYDRLAGGRRAEGPQLFTYVGSHGELYGPFNALLAQPSLGTAVQAVGEALRFEAVVSGSVRELCILAVAVHYECEFEWYAHSAIARSIGLGEEALEAIACGLVPRELSEIEKAALALTKALLDGGEMDPDVVGHALVLLGDDGAFEVAILVGYYGLLANLIQAFGGPLPPGVSSVLPSIG